GQPHRLPIFGVASWPFSLCSICLNQPIDSICNFHAPPFSRLRRSKLRAHSRNIISGTPESERSERDERSGSRRTAMSGGERAFFPRLTAAPTTLKRDLAVPREVNLV